MKFNLTVNSQEIDGFKLVSEANTKEELDILERLVTALTAKITKIEVSVKNYED
jgi:hypothetical protein